jgi:hypothetical protein
MDKSADWFHTKPMKRLTALLLVTLLGTASAFAADPPVVEVWRSRSCGCCMAWVRHARAAGFEVRVNDVDDVAPIKQRFKVPPALASCHTAVVNGYVIEGHVPADDILRLLKEKPAVTGIFVPGMPVGSPGMDGPQGDSYDVIVLDGQGQQRVFATHQP